MVVFKGEGFAGEVGTDVDFGGFSVGGAVDGVGHVGIFAGPGAKVNRGREFTLSG